LIFEEGSFGVGVCIEVFLVVRATSPKWGVRSNRSVVRVRAEEEHDAIHSIAREVGEFCRGVKDVLLLFLRGRVRG